MSDEAPFRIAFDNARDPYTARNALGIAGTGAGLVTSVTSPLTVTGGNLTINLTGYVTNVGTPTSGQYGRWTGATTIAGVSPATVLSDIGAAASTDFPAGAWTNWTLVPSAGSGTFTTVTVSTARYAKAGKTITAYFDLTVVNAGSAGSFFFITLPVTAAGGGTVFAKEIAVTGYNVGGYLIDTTHAAMTRYDGAVVTITGYRLVGTIIYEAA